MSRRSDARVPVPPGAEPAVSARRGVDVATLVFFAVLVVALVLFLVFGRGAMVLPRRLGFSR